MVSRGAAPLLGSSTTPFTRWVHTSTSQRTVSIPYQALASSVPIPPHTWPCRVAPAAGSSHWLIGRAYSPMAGNGLPGLLFFHMTIHTYFHAPSTGWLSAAAFLLQQFVLPSPSAYLVPPRHSHCWLQPLAYRTGILSHVRQRPPQPPLLPHGYIPILSCPLYRLAQCRSIPASMI